MLNTSLSNSYTTTSFSGSLMANDGGLHYPELYDKAHKSVSRETTPELKPCSVYFLKGNCSDGHKYLKAIFCGREWCPDCGKKGSEVHKRRVARWYDKAYSLKKFGYLVVTIPEQIRPYFCGAHVAKNKREIGQYYLKQFRTYCKRKLQRMGYDKGLIRYHWAGDCKYCKDAKGNATGCEMCNFTGSDNKFNPHLNIIIEEGYLKKEKFDEKFIQFKKDIQRWFINKFKKDVVGNIFYSYANNPAHRMHKLKYITRATWRHYKPEIINVIKGFRTSSQWGKFTDEKGEKITVESSKKKKSSELNELVSLENNQCPICGGGIKWSSELILRRTFEKINTTFVAAGYYLINDT